MITLHQYQSTNVNDVRQSLAKHKHIIDCAATGAGKSVIFVAMAQGSLTRSRTVLILSESLQIFNQIQARVPDSILIADGCAKDLKIIPGKLHLAMAQTLQRREQIIKQLNGLGSKLFIINDEAHVGTATKVLQQLKDAYLVGFTATPYYKTAKHLPILYDDIVIGPQPRWLVDNGYLSKYKHFARQSADLTKLRKGNNGEFTEASQEEAFNTGRVYDGLKEDLTSGKFRYNKALIFCASIHHAEETLKELSQVLPVTICHSLLPKTDQVKNLAAFRNGAYNVCISVGQLTKGYDFPAIDLVILNRATNSLPLYFQMMGRASRTDDGKHLFTVIDYGDNYSRFGLWDDFVDWKNLWNKLPKKPKDGAKIIKLCPSCLYITSSQVKVCPNCGFEYPIIITNTIKNSILVEVTEQYNKLRGRKVSTLKPKELAVYATIKNKKMYATRVAKSLSLSNQWYLDEFALAMGYKEGWVDYQKKSLAGLTTLPFYDLILS